MKIRFVSFLIVVFAVLTAVGICIAYPEPAIVQSASDWTLEVVFDQPRHIVVKSPGDKQAARYWYIVLSLRNNSGRDAEFYSAGDLMTDTFKVVAAGKKVRKPVFDAIKLKHQGKYPFLEWVGLTSNKMLQGADNARDIVIIWPDFDAKAKNITLFVAGLSNETTSIDHPTETDKDGQPLKVYLRKTLALDYSIGGDETLRAGAGLVYKGKRWVMR